MMDAYILSLRERLGNDGHSHRLVIESLDGAKGPLEWVMVMLTVSVGYRYQDSTLWQVFFWFLPAQFRRTSVISLPLLPFLLLAKRIEAGHHTMQENQDPASAASSRSVSGTVRQS